jgi:hypothetical protein
METVTEESPEPLAVVPAQATVEDDELPFWHPAAQEQDDDPEDTGQWPAASMRRGRRRASERRPEPSRPRRPQRRPVIALVAAIVLGLLATFFAWVSAEPLWLAVGHGTRGTAVATQCSASGVPYPCVEFTAADGSYNIQDVALLGTDQGHLKQGMSVPARMVSPHSSRAYAVDTVGLNLRWTIGLALVVLCGLGIAWATGATRLDDRGSRRRAFLACVGAPLLLALGFLAATW